MATDDGGEAAIPAPWHPVARIAFRFATCYLVLYNLPFPLGYLPLTDTAAGWYEQAWQAIVPWVGVHVLHLDRPLNGQFNGSGDTTFHWVRAACFVAVALVATLVWSLLDRKRTRYDRLHQGLRVYVRLALAFTLLTYGSMKIFPVQMPAPPLSVLAQPIGSASPQRLLWTFLGASPAYESFSGAAETLAGLLLLVPRLTTLGALVSLGVMVNVFMLNMCYDVSVKLSSFHLLLMSVFLAGPDLMRLADLFLLHRRVELSPVVPLFRRPIFDRVAVAAQVGLGLVFLAISLSGARESLQSYTATMGPPLEGAWTVEQHAVDGTDLPPLATSDTRWWKVRIDSPERSTIQLMNGKQRYVRVRVDPANGALTLDGATGRSSQASLKYEETNARVLKVRGQLDGHAVEMTWRRDAPYLLTSRGFRWINEYPFNTSQAEGGGSGGGFRGTAHLPGDVAAGKHVVYSGFIRTTDVTEGYAGLWFRADGAEGPAIAFDNMAEHGVTGTTEWARHEIAIDVPAAAKDIVFGVLHSGDGTAWFDSLHLEIGGQPYDATGVLDLDFETSPPLGFRVGGVGYEVAVDDTTANTGTHSLRSRRTPS